MGKHKNIAAAIVRAAALMLILALSAAAFAGCGSQSSENQIDSGAVDNEPENSAEPSGGEAPETVGAGESFNIPVSGLSEDIGFYSFELDGLEMEILAAKDSDGTLRTAFNTCQVCNGSRKAYFEKDGEHVVCQNCGNRFSLADVGVISGGCNPYPITADERTDTEESIQLSYDFLAGYKSLFAKWKDN